MARSKVILGKSGDSRHSVEVEGDAETVMGVMKNGWAELNRAREGEERDVIYVNADNVLYVEPARSGQASF
jgi:hypothetical protein